MDVGSGRGEHRRRAVTAPRPVSLYGTAAVGLRRISPSRYKQRCASRLLGKGGGRNAHANTAALSERPRLRSSRCLGHVEVSYQDARLMHGDVPLD